MSNVKKQKIHFLTGMPFRKIRSGFVQK